MSPERLRLTTVATVVAAIAVASIAFAPVFDGRGWTIAVVGGAAVAAALATGITLLRPHDTVWVLVGVEIVGFLAWSLLGVSRMTTTESVPGSGPGDDLVGGLTDGWESLLADTLPLPDDRSALVFVAFVAWSVAAVSIALIAHRATPIGALVGIPVFLTLGIAAALPDGVTAALIGAATGTVLLLLVATMNREDGDRWSPSRLTLLAAVLIPAAGAAALLGWAAGAVDDSPVDPRSTRALEQDTLAVDDLLARFSDRIADEDAVMLRVRSTDGGETPDVRLRLQVYDTYDGERWSSSTRYSSVAAVPPPDILPPGRPVAVLVTEQDFIGPQLGLPDRVTELVTDNLQWDPETETAIAQGVASYEVRGTVVDRSGLDDVPVDRTIEGDQLSELPPGLSPAIGAAASEAVGGADGAAAEIRSVTELVSGLGREEGRTPGHSLARVTRDLTEGRATGAEQLVTLHALMLRELGYPSRVVVGYLVTDEEVAATDLHAWVEVPYEGRGWIAYDAVPLFADATTAAEDIDDATPEPTIPETTDPEDLLEAQSVPRQLDPDERTSTDPAADGPSPVLLGAIALVAITVIALLALVGARAARRNSRKSAARPDERVVGAWAELVDRLRESGDPPPRSATIDEVVASAAGIDEAVGAAARPLGDLAADALHGRDGPSAEAADEAWRHLTDAEHAMVAACGHRVTARRLVDPRVLRHRTPVPPRRR